MHPQLRAIADEFEAARARFRALLAAVPRERWRPRIDPARWSPAECIGHLNLTTDAFRPLVEAAVEEGRRQAKPGEQGAADAASGKIRRYRRGPLGWVVWKMSGPQPRFRVKTAQAFVPGAAVPDEDLTAGFERRLDEQIDWVRRADGLPLERLRITSPFDARVRYNLYACLSILARHTHRHLAQAEEGSRLKAQGSGAGPARG